MVPGVPPLCGPFRHLLAFHAATVCTVGQWLLALQAHPYTTVCRQLRRRWYVCAKARTASKESYSRSHEYLYA